MDYEKKYKDAMERAKKWGLTHKLCIEDIFPELVESEDERIRRCIGVILTDATEQRFTDYGVSLKDCLALLEKQKELDKMIVVSPEVWDNAISDAYENGKKEGEKQKEQKHPNGCFTCDEYKKGYEEGRRNGFTAGYNKAMKEVEQKEQKPAEWSANDKAFIKDCARILDENGYEASAERLLSMFPVKPAEWSEEDEKQIRQIERIVKDAGGSVKLQEQIHNWFKSLRHSWKPSEQEKGALRTAISILTEERSFPKAAAHLQAILDAFDNKEARKDWKPSEEQMSALNYFIKLWGNSDDQLEYTQIFINVKSLYEQLKKL